MSNIQDTSSFSTVDTEISGDDSNQTNANNVDQTNETSFLKGISQTVEGAVVDVANGIKDTVTEIKSSDTFQGMSQTVAEAKNETKDQLGLSNETTDVDKTNNVDNVDKAKENADQTPSDNNNKALNNEKNNNKADESTPKTFFQKVSSMPYNAASATIGAASSTLNTVNNAGINYIGKPIYNTAAAVGNAVYNTAEAAGNGVKKVVTIPFTIISSINPFASRQEEKKEESVQK